MVLTSLFLLLRHEIRAQYLERSCNLRCTHSKKDDEKNLKYFYLSAEKFNCE